MRHGRRIEAALVAFGLVLASCTTTTQPSTTSGGPGTTALPVTTSSTVDPLLLQALPVDPLVRRGALDNGLRYYLRENDSPGGRVELRLLVDAGSVQEESDQAGMAHFLEHMMFNGTDRFPRNELIAVLEAFGPRFGPDINAYTTFDETVYELSLTTDPELVRLGVDVLREWASRATLTETDVIEERGIVLDEWRLRAQGFGARVNDQIQSLILPGSVYEDKDPIGTADSITGTTASDLERFYGDWYQPERMAVVAVGDFDVSEMEDLIARAFGDMPTVSDPLVWRTEEFERPAEPRVASFVDEEAAVAGVTAVWPMPSPQLVTVGDYQTSLATSIGLGILADRLGDDASDAGSPLLGSGVLDFAWTRGVEVKGLDVEVRAERVGDGLESVLTEVERVRRHGINTGEFQRAMDGFSAVSQQVYEQRESLQDVRIAAQIVDHHLSGADLMSPSQRFEVESGILGRLTIADVERALLGLVDGSPVVLVVAPDDEGLDIPDETRIIEVLDASATATIAPREDIDPGETLLMTPPDPTPIASSRMDPRFGFTTLTFDNGATVYLWESDIAAGAVHASVEGFGGTSLMDVDELVEAFVMTDIVARSGVAGFDVPALRRILADRIAAVSPWVSETRQGIAGDSSTSDVEWLFQLIHLTMSKPRFDATATDAVLDELRTVNASRADLPDLLYEEAVNDAYYGDDPRYFVIPTDSQLDTFDRTTAERLFRERFSDASQFAFVFVGDFETPQMIDLAARYIGTLPGSGEVDGFVDNQPLPPREVQVRTVEAGADEQGSLGMYFTNELEPRLEDRLTGRLLELVLSVRLRERIREELSATYSITTGIDLQRDPDSFAEAFISSTGDPAGLEEISSEILAEIVSLQSEGPTDAEFSTAVAQLRDELDLVNNLTLATALVTAHLYPDQPVAELADRYDVVGELTAEDVRRMAGIVFHLGQRIEVRLVPRG